MSVRLIIVDEMTHLAAEHGKNLATLTDNLPLLESGLDSLCFAILVARLEDITGRDPFASLDASRYPKTVGDLVGLYDGALV